MTKYYSDIKVAVFLTVIFIFSTFGCGEDQTAPPKERASKKIIVKTEKAATDKAATAMTADKAGKEEQAAAVSQAGSKEDELLAQKTTEKVSELYDPTGKINPFIPLFQEEKVQHDIDISSKSDKSAKKKRLFVGPLEKVDITQLKLTGVILSQKGNKALVEEANGKGYVVTVGTYIGIRDGRISKIERDRIIVDEVDENELGKEYIKKNELKLQKPPGEF